MRIDSAVMHFTNGFHGYDVATNTFKSEDQLVEQQVRTLFDGSAVKRFHTMATVRENTIGQHSHGVAMLLWLLTGGNIRVELLMAALTHDLAEQWTGDLPSPSKRALGISSEFGEVEDQLLDAVQFGFDINEAEQSFLKLADCLDGMMFLIRERSLGNTGPQVWRAWRNFSSYTETALGNLKHQNPPMYQRAYDVISAVNRLWQEQIA